MTESPDVPWAKHIDERIKKEFTEPPSRAAFFLHAFLAATGVKGGRLIDIGCGNGRNSVFFAKEGFEVHAVDRSDDVLKDLDLHGVMPHCHSVTDFWLFEDSFFDIAMDIFCYCYQTDAEKKRLYRSELTRVLRPEGLYLLSVPSTCSVEEVEKEFEAFEVLLYEKSTDIVDGKSVGTLNIIMKKK